MIKACCRGNPKSYNLIQSRHQYQDNNCSKIQKLDAQLARQSKFGTLLVKS